MKLPRDLRANDLAQLLKKYGYKQTRQTGSHIRLTTTLKGEHHVTVVKHGTIKVGTLNGVLAEIAKHLEMGKRELMADLFG